MVFKRRLTALLALSACGLFLVSGSTLCAPSQTLEAAKNYSGYGSMSLKATTAYLFPGIACKFNDVDPEAIVSWDVDKASSEAVLNTIATQINIDWVYQNKVLIFTKKQTQNIAPLVGNQGGASVQSGVIPKYVKSEPVKEVVIAQQAQNSTKMSVPATAVKPQPLETEIVEWVVKAPKGAAGSSLPKAVDFQITSEDETLSLALRRWSSNAGYQLSWEAGKDFSARATSYNSPDVISAIESVMNDTAHSNFPLHACVYDNKVIRILQVSQGCGKTNTEDQY